MIQKKNELFALTTTDREVSGGGCSAIKDSPVQKVNGGFGVDDLEDLTEE